MNTPIKIDKNIPVSGKTDAAHTRYPFRQMKVGDSFSVAAEDAGDGGLRIRPAASYFAIRNPEFKFTIRKQADGSYRVWRIAA